MAYDPINNPIYLITQTVSGASNTWQYDAPLADSATLFKTNDGYFGVDGLERAGCKRGDAFYINWNATTTLMATWKASVILLPSGSLSLTDFAGSSVGSNTG